MTTATSQERRYGVAASSTATPGRVLCSARHHHFVVDGPVGNGFPGEAITPIEVFLAAVASCGVELLQAFARQDGIPLETVRVQVEGAVDRSRPVRPDATVLSWATADFELGGVSQEQGEQLVERFKKT
ncbi:MAG TPA: OsmC family protein [Kofleriaceae bacterium]|nr:OsmC family protein [Kofleriaceae bacterium]